MGTATTKLGVIMGRPRKTINVNLPDNVYLRLIKRKSGKIVRRYTYRLTDKKELELGTDYNKACLTAAKLNLERDIKSERITFSLVAKRYKEEVISQKKSSTAENNLKRLVPLLQFFSNAPIDEIEPRHIQEYMQRRKATPGAANNEFALFSHIWRHARIWGYTNIPSPTECVPKFPIKKREIYVEDHIYSLVYAEADQIIRDLMDLAYLTGQRPVDVVNIRKEHIFDGHLHIVQQKTEAKIRIQLVGKLKEILLRRINECNGDILFTTKKGEKLNARKLGKRFIVFREKAAKKNLEFAEQILAFQFRDLRAKSGTDRALSQGEDAARQQLGHTSVQMTKTYIRKALAVAPHLDTPTNEKGE